MARPTKTPADQLTFRGGFRLTEAERQQLVYDAAAAGQSVSDYVRGLVVRSKPRRARVTPELQALVTGLGVLGNIRADINQLIRDRHAYRFVKPEDVEAALKAVSTLADLILSELPANGD